MTVQAYRRGSRRPRQAKLSETRRCGLRAKGRKRTIMARYVFGDEFKPSERWKRRNPPVRAAGQAGRGFLGEGFLSQRLARAATSALSRSASKALGLKSSPSHSRVSAWRSWPGSSSASSISP